MRARDQWATAGELRKRLLAAFHEHGIEIPRPQRVVLARDPAPGLRRRRRGREPGPRVAPGTTWTSARRTRVRRGEARPDAARVEWPGHRRTHVSVDTPRPTRSRTSSPSAAPIRPSPEFAAQANAKAALYEEAERDFEAFWAKLARERISWSKPFETTLEWDLPFAKWFTGGELNVAYNCVDRHVENGLGDKVAYHWIGEPGDTRTLTYADLKREVRRPRTPSRSSASRRATGSPIYMPMIPELPIAMLACARIGAPHTVVFGGFSRRGAVRPHQRRRGEARHHRRRRLAAGQGQPQAAVDEAVADARPIENVIVVDRFGDARHAPCDGRDLWWHDLVDRQSEDCPPVPVDSEHMLYLLYTSGTTAKPKGILHTTAGYLLGTSYTHEMIFDLKPDDVYWCAADIGWVTGHSYIVYGPLANARPACSTRARPTRRTGTAGGRSSRTTRSRSCTARRPRSARS